MGRSIHKHYVAVLGKEGDHGNPDKVCQHGQRHGQDDQQQPLPGVPEGETGDDKRKDDYSQDGPQPAAGIDHLQGGIGQLNDIPFPANRDSQQLQNKK